MHINTKICVRFKTHKPQEQLCPGKSSFWQQAISTHRSEPHLSRSITEIQSMKKLFQMEGLSPPATGTQLTAATDVAIRQKDRQDPEHLQFTENHKLCLLFIIFVETQK